MEVELIRRAPRPVALRGQRVSRRRGAEEVHAPVGAARRDVVDVEEAQRDLHLRHPGRLGRAEGRARDELVGREVGDEEGVEGGAGGAHLGGVVDEGGEGHVVGRDLEL